MKNKVHMTDIPPAGPETVLEMKKYPSMGSVLLKALLISPFRSSTIADNAVIGKCRIILKNCLPDKQRIQNYRTVCGFSGDSTGSIPITYFQTLFNGLIARLITSSFFPLKPLGLIHVFQSFEQKRAVRTDERLDLACILSGMRKSEKGIETDCTLEVTIKGELVWQGVSTFFTRGRIKAKKPSGKKENRFLEKKAVIAVPSGTGRNYAAVSGDYNPHHLHAAPAKLFGFKQPIAHGMWSLARVVASLDRKFDIHDAATIEAAFKLPIFMPATTVLGYERRSGSQSRPAIVEFELRDEQKGLPHLKGRLLYKH